MKMILITTALLTALGMMSFSVAPNSGITRIGEELYNVAPGAQMADADRNTLADEIARQYNLGDWKSMQKEVLLDPKPSAKGKWILHHKLGLITVFEDDFIRYDVTTVAAADEQTVRNLEAVLSKY